MYCVRFLLLLTFFDFYLYNLFVTNCEKYFLGGYIPCHKTIHKKSILSIFIF